MELSYSRTIVHGHPPLPRQDGIHLSPHDDDDLSFLTPRSAPQHKNGLVSDSSNNNRENGSEATTGVVDKGKSCERLRPEEEERLRPRDSMTNMSSLLIGKTVTPFLKEHIPRLYAPIGKPNNEQTAREKNPNTRYCYRHRPDSKCRRAADEAKMVMIQSELDKLTPAVRSFVS